jgi:hypothetical protein
VKRSIILAALLLAACDNKPTGFGVDVEARTGMLTESVRNSIVSARLLVTGAETFTKDIAGVAKAAQSGAFKFRYVPGVHSGTLTIRVDGLDASGATVAGGTAPPVTLVDGKAVDAVLTLAINGNGVTCMAGTDCISGNCADGVCCDTPCDGVCESCNQAGLVGACSPAMTGTDPDHDCIAKLAPAPDDGGINDDGGIMSMPPPMADNPGACGGSCDGMRACAFADTTTSCGTPVCAATATVGSFFCDGAGTCNEKDTGCTDYNCNMGACRTLCSADSDCQPTDFCNLNINKCVPKHDLGTACMMGDECKSTFCYSGVCCNTTCGDMTQSCVNPTPGQCQCTGHACPPGVACVLFYRDGDKDGFGDATANLTNGRAVAGCVGDTPPTIGGTPYRADNTDCDDADANAFPGQTAFFATPSAGTGSFDYNCNGNPNEKETPEFTAGCIFCVLDTNFFVCAKPAGTCATNGTQSALTCGRTKTCFGCCPITTSGLTVSVACGQSHTTTVCGTCTADNGGPTTSVGASVTQRCH